MTPIADTDNAPVARILVVDDDVILRVEIADYLSQHGYAVETAADGVEMQVILTARAVDLIVLDLMLPGEDGLSICRRLAEQGGPPIIMVSAMGHDTDRIVGLELGADDYLPKPCNPRELVARVRAVLRRREDIRRGGAKRGRTINFRGFSVDPARRRLRAPNGVTILLTVGEFALLGAFLDHPQRILSREQLLELARGGDAEVFDRAVDVQISRLRRKLHGCSDVEIIKTYRGSGYLFDAKVTRA
ncbi:MAG: response regulator [Proteobacteria bacterium]|nr:response regulator [Pseudomonadota bacterium]